MDSKDLKALHRFIDKTQIKKDSAEDCVSAWTLPKSDEPTCSNHYEKSIWINEIEKSQFYTPVLNLDLKLCEVWCRYILYSTFCQGLQQYRLKKGVPIIQGNCIWSNQAVANYFATNPEINIATESSIPMMAERLTADMLKNRAFACNQCIPKLLPPGILKVNGSLVVRHNGGISIDNMNLISQDISSQPLLNLLKYQSKNTLIQRFFENKRDFIRDFPCFCWTQPEMVSLARFWYLQKNILTNVDVKNDAGQFRKAKILTVTNEPYIFHQIEQFSKVVESFRNKSALKNILPVFYLLSGGKINGARKIASLIAKIIYHGCFGNEDKAIKVVVTNQPEIVKKFLNTVFMFGFILKDKVLRYCDNSRNIIQNYSFNLPIPSFRENGKFYHLTNYSVDQLQNPAKLPNFHQDALYGHLLNITDLSQGNFEENSYLDKVSKGKAVSYKHPIFGKSEFNPIGSYVFITDKISHKYFGDVINKDDYEVYYLTDVTPCKDFVFESFETAIMLTYISEWGNKEYNELSDNREIDPVKWFFEKCVERREFTYKPGKGGTQKPDINEENATSFRTVNAAYTRFCNLLPIKSKINFDTNLIEENEFLVTKDKENKIRERDLQRGFSDDEVLGVKSNSSYVVGCVVKSPQEIETIACQVINEWEKEEMKLSQEDFFSTMEKEILG